MSKNDEIIIITAARPGLWMKEHFSPSAIKRWLGETFYKDYGKTMEKLRQIDDAIYEWVKDIEKLYKELKQRQKQPGPMDDKRVVDIARLLGGINRRFKKIDRAGDILEDLTESHLKEFENTFPVRLPEEGEQFHELSEKDTKELERFRETYDADDADDMMLAEAGFWDDLRTKWLTRKMETKSVKERRKAIKKIIDQAGSLVRQMKGTLKNLSKARASGDVGQYLDALNTISEEQQKFENSFVEVYETYVKEHVDKMLENEATDTTVDQQTGEVKAPKTIEEEIVEDLGGKVEPGESVPQDPEEWMASQIMQDDIEIAPTEPSPFGNQPPPTIPSAQLLPSFTEKPPSTQPSLIDADLPSKLQRQSPASQSNQPKTKGQKQTEDIPGKKVKKWQPPSFRDIFVQEEPLPQTEPIPQTEPSASGPEEVTFEGISPNEMHVDEISSGKGTAHIGPVKVQLARIDRAFRDFFEKTSSLPVDQKVKAMLSASAKFESVDEEISQTFLSLAEQILENAE